MRGTDLQTAANLWHPREGRKLVWVREQELATAELWGLKRAEK